MDAMHAHGLPERRSCHHGRLKERRSHHHGRLKERRSLNACTKRNQSLLKDTIKRLRVLLAGVFVAVPTPLTCRRQTFPGPNTLPSSEYVQYPLPPCILQVFHFVLTITLVQPPGPPPCFVQRPLRREVVVQPATEHGLFQPPCLPQCADPGCALVVHPANLHVPHAPCLAQTPRALARVVQPSSLHTFLLPPPCLPHRPLARTALVHLLNEQNPSAPCLPQSPCAFVMVVQPSIEQGFLQ